MKKTFSTPALRARVALLLACTAALSACSGEAPRTPYEARQQFEAFLDKTSDAKTRLDQTADKTVETAKELSTSAAAMAERAVEVTAPAVEATKEGLTALGDTVLGVADKAQQATRQDRPAEPPPADVTQPAVRLVD